MWNLLEICILVVTAVYTLTGYLVNYHENLIPVVLVRITKYGSFGCNGKDAKFINKLDVPKSLYRHFYMFACSFEIFNLAYMMFVYIFAFDVNAYYARFLEVLHGNTSPVSVLATVAALSLLTLQCIRRCYETYCVQVFANTSKMNVIYYMYGVLHYFILTVAVVGRAPLFCGDKNRDKIVWIDLWTVCAVAPALITFIWSWHEQYQTNLILANLRKDKKSGQVVTEEHRIPHGRLFESVSSPHRYCEVIMYCGLFAIIPSMTFFCIFIWVLCNQVITALLAHGWYKKTFENYPPERYAIFKGIL